jgi:hypothetical protein
MIQARRVLAGTVAAGALALMSAPAQAQQIVPLPAPGDPGCEGRWLHWGNQFFGPTYSPSGNPKAGVGPGIAQHGFVAPDGSVGVGAFQKHNREHLCMGPKD